jgi:hypothetical protein
MILEGERLAWTIIAASLARMHMELGRKFVTPLRGPQSLQGSDVWLL